ncbi:MAG: sigma-54-dependent transcriptional regulator [Myxococcaceae bacterium]
MSLFRSVLVADDEASIRHVLSLVLSERGYEVRAVANGEDVLAELGQRAYDVVLCDVRMPKLSGLEVLPKALALSPDITFIMMSAYGSPEMALEAVGAGAYDYIQKPFKPEEVVVTLRKAEERQRLLRENRRLQASLGHGGPLDALVGKSEAMEKVRRQVAKLAPVNTTVLVTGESGTGKELVARALHGLSPRAAWPFVAVNCGAISEGLIESELFGHTKGAFTDAKTAKRGLFAEADGGTILLDEVGELPPSAQVALLRVLQEGEIRPVGEARAEKIDVRVVAATLRDLAKLVERGEFREDLYYRLNVVNIAVPPLRARSEDVLLLADLFRERFNREFNRDPPVREFTREAKELLKAYRWPGNVRELENAVERAVLLAEGEAASPEHLPERLWEMPPKGLSPTRPEAGSDLSLKRAMRALEESHIRAALKQTKGNRTRAAELLEISHRALLYKIKEYGIDPDEGRS